MHVVAGMELTLLSAKLSEHLWALATQELARAQKFQTFGIFEEANKLRRRLPQDMKTGFWLSEDPIGKDIICPRDGRPGCALVDWMPRLERREQTHFMSWTWKYSLQQVRGNLGSGHHIHA